MIVSCCIWGLPIAQAEAARQLGQMGFDGADVRPTPFSEPPPRPLLDLPVHCMAASHGLPQGASLDHRDPTLRAGAIAYSERAMAQAAHLGATAVYLVPGVDAGSEGLSRYAAVVGSLAQRAADHGMSLSLEHFPGLALPTVAAAKAFVESVDHPNLKVLVDTGHAQMEGITPAAAIDMAADRLGYVHLNDNDGEADLHLGLLDGVLTGKQLRDVFAAIGNVGYGGPVSLELHPELADSAAALEESLRLVREAAAGAA